MLDNSAITSALVFRDKKGRHTARGVTGVRYLFPCTWVVQHAPDLPTHAANSRWLYHWRKLPELKSWGWLDDLITTDHTRAHGLRMLKVPITNYQEPVAGPVLNVKQQQAATMRMVSQDAAKLQGYIKHLKGHGSVMWRDITGYGFTINAGRKWVVYDRRRIVHFTTNLGW